MPIGKEYCETIANVWIVKPLPYLFKMKITEKVRMNRMGNFYRYERKYIYKLKWNHQKLTLTRMYSSSMRTAHSLTVSLGGCLPRGRGVCQGESAQEVCPGGCLPGELSAQVVSAQWVSAWECLTRGCLPRGCHVTYPIMHLILPVCCPCTNWDWSPVQLLI